ncbi:hypothetical protein M514_12115 [Trichuris suis]|uniref:Uncharacterized protein n=1 Tax=Trichuris suis TaxID=68888 RepID=A0A085MXB1_9BILA|nr:hypothetical protein M513_12115 [Trichuris suis]KFD61857.1 hypothetical protein M514_12115 [Trichuris suis]
MVLLPERSNSDMTEMGNPMSSCHVLVQHKISTRLCGKVCRMPTGNGNANTDDHNFLMDTLWKCNLIAT